MRAVVLVKFFYLSVPAVCATIACIQNYDFSIGIFKSPLNWFQALASCQQFGYTGLLVGPYKSAAAMHHLLENGISLQDGAYFWDGYYKPLPNASWHSKCSPKDMPISQASDAEQCVTAYFYGSNGSTARTMGLEAKHCWMIFPFLCMKTGSEYKTISFMRNTDLSPLSIGTAEIDYYGVTYDYCLDKFQTSKTSPVFTYNHLTGLCRLRVFNNGYAKLEFDTHDSSENITLAWKNGCYSATIYGINVTDSLVYDADGFPRCNVTETLPTEAPASTECPSVPGTCFCNKTLTDNEFSKIIQALRVEAKETSRAQRKYVSAEDNRMSSKFIGGAGVVVIVAIFALLLIVDLSSIAMVVSPEKPTSTRRNRGHKSKVHELKGHGSKGQGSKGHGSQGHGNKDRN